MTPRTRLRWVLSAFFAALAVPAIALVIQARERLQWEAFHQQQRVAEELTARIDHQLGLLLAREDARAFTEYAFFNVLNPDSPALLQRSPLAQVPVDNALPGLVGHFQIDTDGRFEVPFLPPSGTPPAAVGLSAEALAVRQALAARMQTILRDNQLLARAPRTAPAPPPPTTGATSNLAAAPTVAETDSLQDRLQDAPATPASVRRSTSADARMARRAPAPTAQAAFDELEAAGASAAVTEKRERNLGRVADLALEKRYAMKSATREAQSAPAARAPRKEQNVLPEPAATVAPADPGPDAFRIRTFESEVDPMSVSLLGSGELVVYRRVWRDGQRIVQGLLLDLDPFLSALIEQPFQASVLSASSTLVIAYRGDVQAMFAQGRGREYPADRGLQGTLLQQARLSAPFSDFELLYSVVQLPAGAGARVVGWLGAVLGFVLCAGTILMYRLGLRQIALAQQQQDFVSAVSHELKTPLTSIRMYGEMLREGWAPEDKRPEYYAFIHDESERLSRLIHNVLSLARMTRNELQVSPERVKVAQLLDLVRSKAGSVISHAGREFVLACPPELASRHVEVDLDCFTQIVLNLVDNALKFSAQSPQRRIDLTWREDGRQHLVFAVRDYGPGIPKDQLDKIFGLFYRVEDPLTRATGGTGIGLALVQRLARAIGGTVTVSNRSPGVEFALRLRFH